MSSEVQAYCRGVEATCPECGAVFDAEGWGYAEVEGVPAAGITGTGMNVFEELRAIYRDVDLSKFPQEYFRWCVGVQLREIRLAGTVHDRAKEWADIITVSIHALESLGAKAEDMLAERVEKHRKGRDEILAKYGKMFHLSQGDLCQICGRVVESENEIKFLCCDACYERGFREKECGT